MGHMRIVVCLMLLLSFGSVQLRPCTVSDSSIEKNGRACLAPKLGIRQEVIARPFLHGSSSAAQEVMKQFSRISDYLKQTISEEAREDYRDAPSLKQRRQIFSRIHVRLYDNFKNSLFLSMHEPEIKDMIRRSLLGQGPQGQSIEGIVGWDVVNAELLKNTEHSKALEIAAQLPDKRQFMTDILRAFSPEQLYALSIPRYDSDYHQLKGEFRKILAQKENLNRAVPEADNSLEDLFMQEFSKSVVKVIKDRIESTFRQSENETILNLFSRKMSWQQYEKRLSVYVWYSTGTLEENLYDEFQDWLVQKKFLYSGILWDNYFRAIFKSYSQSLMSSLDGTPVVYSSEPWVRKLIESAVDNHRKNLQGKAAKQIFSYRANDNRLVVIPIINNEYVLYVREDDGKIILFRNRAPWVVFGEDLNPEEAVLFRSFFAGLIKSNAQAEQLSLKRNGLISVKRTLGTVETAI